MQFYDARWYLGSNVKNSMNSIRVYTRSLHQTLKHSDKALFLCCTRDENVKLNSLLISWSSVSFRMFCGAFPIRSERHTLLRARMSRTSRSSSNKWSFTWGVRRDVVMICYLCVPLFELYFSAETRSLSMKEKYAEFKRIFETEHWIRCICTREKKNVTSFSYDANLVHMLPLSLCKRRVSFMAPKWPVKVQGWIRITTCNLRFQP